MKNHPDEFSNKTIAHLLRSVAAAYLLKGENRFKIIAYENAADTVDRLDRELKDIWSENKLNQVPGIGPSIGAHLDEYFQKGSSKHFDEVLKGIPETVFILMKIPTIGPKRAFKLVKTLKLFDKDTLVEDLKQAGEAGKIAKIPTFGEKSQEEILKSIRTYEKRKIKVERMPLPYAFAIAERIVEYLKKNPKIKRVDVLGSLRRMAPTIGDVDIAVAADPKDVKEVINYFINYKNKISVDNAGGKKASIIINPYVRVDLRVQEEETYGSMLQYFTGSKSHNINLREYAIGKGYSLSEYGIKKIRNKSKTQISKFKTEESFYNFLGLEYIPPEIREGTDEIDLAQKYKLPQLVEIKDIKGDFHIHSNYDLKPSHDLGVDSFLDIAKKAKNLGYEYIGFADHNPSLSGNSHNEIISIMKKRKEYIDQIFSTHKFDQFKYFIGLEIDILPSGKLALPDKAFDYIDYAIASIHSSFGEGIQKMTYRILEAIKHPKVKIIGHPTGRKIGSREGYDLEWVKIFEACREYDVALEVNSWPERLDLPDVLIREAINNQVKLVINTDSHEKGQMDNMFYGVYQARRGWAKKSDIINTRSNEKLKKWIGGDKI